MEQSPVEFLESQYNFNKQLFKSDFKKAKEMEREQIKDAYYKGGDDLTKMHFIEPEEYYKETFKSE